MAKILIILSIFICLASCSSKLPTNKVIKEYASPANAFIDTSRVAILSYTQIIDKKTGKSSLFGKCKQAELTEQDVKELEFLFRQGIDTLNLRMRNFANQLRTEHPSNIHIRSDSIDIVKYKRQYIVVANENGEKEVWINCFCTDFDKNWKKQIIHTVDGWICFFNFKINLTKKKVYDFHVNGSA